MSEERNNLEDIEPGQQADEGLVHSLLLHIHDDRAAEHREQRVGRAMRAIRESGSQQAAEDVSAAAAHQRRVLRFPVWARRETWAAAAAIVVALEVWMLTSSPTPALASLNDIINALGRPGDRTFHIQMLDLAEPPGRAPPDDPRPAPKPGLDDATLYLRDDQIYVLVRHDPKGGLIFDGFDGQQSWRVRDSMVAQTKEGLGAGGIPLPPLMADVPFSDLHRTVERIRVDYSVEQLDQAALSSGGPMLRHVRVRRNSRQVKGPETIEIWADPQTAMPRRIIFDRAKIQGNQAPCRLTFDLVSQEPLPSDWFSPTTHASNPEAAP